MASISVRMPDGTMQPMTYPDNWNDDQVKEAIYKNFPNSNEETEADNTTGFKGILNDIGTSISNVPGALGDFVSNLPWQLKSSISQVGRDPLRATENLGAGLLEGLKGAANIPSNIASYLGDKDIGHGRIEEFIKQLHIGDTGLEKAILGENQEGDELLRGIGGFMPYARIGKLSTGASGLSKRALAGGLYATGQEQDPIVAALLGLTGEGVTNAVQKLARKSTYLPNSPLSNEELKEAANVVKGTETDLGNVIENPFLKRQFENILPEIPLSGANKVMQRNAANITERGNTLLDSLKGEYEGADIGASLQQALKNAEAETRKIKNEKFELLNNEAEKIGIQTDRSNLRKEAAKILSRISSDKDLKLFSNPKLINILKEISQKKGIERSLPPERFNSLLKEGEEYISPFNFEKTFIPPEYKTSSKPNLSTKGEAIDVITGKPLYKDFSLKKTDFLRGELGDLAHDSYLRNETSLGNIYSQLKKAAESDIAHAVDNSKNDSLKALRDEAFKFYKEEYVPFEDKDIMKFTRKGGDADTLAQYFIRNSRISDRAKLISKLTQHLSESDRDLLSYSYLSNAFKDGELNPSKLKTLYQNLGKRQKEALFSPEMIKNLSDYSELVKKNPEALSQMLNPKTGQRNLTALIPSITTGIGAVATGTIPGVLLSAVAPTILSRPMVKKLTNEKFREKLIDQMIKSRERNKKPPKHLAPFINALMQASQTHKPLELELNKASGYEGEQDGIR